LARNEPLCTGQVRGDQLHRSPDAVRDPAVERIVDQLAELPSRA
jgi:hypothetical protein